MGMQDRDYYREWWAKKEGHVERSPMRVNLGKPPAVRQVLRPVNQVSEWHWSLTVLATVVLCLIVWGVINFAVWMRSGG